MSDELDTNNVGEEQDINKERLELALEAAGLDLWENDLVTGDVTRRAHKIFAELGYGEHEATPYVYDMFRIVHPEDIPVVKVAVADHLTGVTPQYRCEFRLRSKSGAWVWFANYGRIMDGVGSPHGKRFIGVTFNIDDRKRHEDEIEQINRKLAEQNAQLEQMNATLQELAATDSLTGLSNRRRLMEVGENECKRAKRFNHPLSLLILDIDLFKRINDTWGHPVGDRVICAVAEICRRGTRSGVDVVARIGGEEFAIVLPQTDHTSAASLAEWLRATIEAEQITVSEGGNTDTCTVSIGVATLDGGGCPSFDQLLNSADNALYRAKQGGRNRVLGLMDMHDTSARISSGNTELA
ncbi:MAG: diguanylate cyclase [Nitrosomonadales bacterium]|nr:diguanylate cyclase [Nitrosomonadales bacterium]